MEAQTLHQILGLAHQLLKGRVGILGAGELEHFHLVELVAAHHAPLVGVAGTGLPAEAGGVGEELPGQLGFGKNLVPVDGAKSGFRGGQHIVDAVVGGVGNLIDLVGKLGELTGRLAALVLQHVGRQDELVAVGDVAVDEVVQQRPFQTCAHVLIHPEAGTRQLDAPVVVDKTQTLAQVNMVLGGEVKLVRLAKVAQRLVVFLSAGLQVGIGQVGQAQHGDAVFVTEGFQFGQLLLDRLGDLHGLGVVGGNGGVQLRYVLALLLGLLLHAEELAVFLGQLVLLGGLGLGVGFQSADFAVQLQNAVYGGVAVHFLCPQTGLDGVGIFLDFFDVQHDVYLSLNRKFIFVFSSGRPADSANLPAHRIPVQSAPCACR